MITDSSSRARSVAGCLLRAVIAFVIVAGLLAAAYFGITYGAPALYDRYVYPVEQNTQRLQDLEAQQAQGGEQLAGRLDALLGRLEALEIQGDTDREAFSRLQSAFDAIDASLAGLQAARAEAETAQAGAQAALDDLLAAQNATGASVDELQAAQAEAETRLGEASAALDTLAREVAAVDLAVDDLAQAASQSGEQVAALEEDLLAVAAPLAGLQYDHTLLRSLDLLTRAEVHLAQGNVGLARSAVEDTRELLAALQLRLPVEHQQGIAAIVTRLDLALGNLPDAPGLARGDLDVAWRLLLAGLSTEALPAPATILTPTETITPTAVITP